MTQHLNYLRHAPQVTIFVFVYNQQEYIRAACEAVLAQVYESPLEIILSDDCSQDESFQIMSDIAQQYQGIHTIRLNRNPKNLGLIGHVNLSHQLATGELLIAAAGDDISLPNRVTEIVKAYRCAEKQPTSIYSAVYNMSASGKVGDISIPPIQKLPSSPYHYATSSSLIIGAAHAWHRSLFDIFGDIEESEAFEDLVLAYRSALVDGLVYIDKPLVNYRLGVGLSESGKYDRAQSKDRKIIKHKMIRETKIMLPVLRQRLKDSQKIQVDPQLIAHLQNKIIEMELKKGLLKQTQGFFPLFKQAFSASMTLFFLRSWFRLLRKGLL